MSSAAVTAAPAGRPPRARLTWPLAALALIVLIALAAPLIARHDPVTMDVANRLAGMSLAHPFGQDEYGRDIFARLIWGARSTLMVAFVSATIAGLIGVTIGLVGGYFGGIAEVFTIRLADVVLSFPPILLALLIVTIAGPGAGTLILVLSILYVPGFARVSYGETLAARGLEYVEAARALGAGPFRILAGTVLPNIAGPLLVQFSLVAASAILIESGLSFLGLGVVPPAPSWGLMIRSARGVMEHNALNLLWPCLALTLTILVVNRVCDALRDMFDPRTAKAAPRGLLASIAGAFTHPGRAAVATSALPDDVILSARGVTTVFATNEGPFKAIDDVSFDVRLGETLCVVGESGSGKSVTALSILGLLPRGVGTIVAGEILYRDATGAVRDLVKLDAEALRAIRGDEIAMVFQEPMTSLNPVWRIGTQIGEAIRAHAAVPAAALRSRVVSLLESVGIPDAAARARAFPHEMSGGMRQRAMIAMALSGHPRLLIADEPTTALDVTIQAQILALFARLKRESASGMSLVFITHNFGVVAEIADRVLVMYAGKVVEEADAETIFAAPRHPYTRALLASVPEERAAGDARADLPAIPGTVPSPRALPPGCAFAPRCAHATTACDVAPPALETVSPGHRARCIRWKDLS